MWIDRLMGERLLRGAATRPAVLLTGARQTGKTSLLLKLFPKVPYVTFDRLNVAIEAEENPDHFLSRFNGPVIFDEIQYVPSLFRELKIRIDEARHINGRWLLTGSQRFELMTGVSESLAGRIRVLHLGTLGAEEIRAIAHPRLKDYLWKGGYPELWAMPELDVAEFCEDYIDTYLERDLRSIVDVGNLRDFRRFVRACAVRVGQLLNHADLGRDVGVSAPTVKRWLAALEAGGLIHLLPPYFANLGKRLTKAPKLYFADHGLLCHLVRASSTEDWHSHPMRGQLWENLVLGELVKTEACTPGRDLFFYRDQNGVEIDFVVERGPTPILIEAKASERPRVDKVNFSKVGPLLQKGSPTICILACTTAENTVLHTRSHLLLNPLLTRFGSAFGV